MTSQYFEKLVRWFDQKREVLRAKGIDDADPRVVMDAVMRRHFAEIKSDPAIGGRYFDAVKESLASL